MTEPRSVQGVPAVQDGNETTLQYFVSPDRSRTMVVSGDPSWGVPPDGWVEVDRVEFEQQRAQRHAAAEQASAAFLRGARAPRVAAGQALVDLGLTAEHAAALAGVPTADLDTAAA